MLSNIPTEVHSQVLSNLCRKDTLTCALVCRDWVAESRNLALSRPIRITPAEWREEDAKMFIDLLLDPNSTFRLYLPHIAADFDYLSVMDGRRVVTALVEHGAPIHTLRINGMESIQKANIEDDVIRLVAHHLPYLKRLSMECWSPTQEFTQALLETISAAPALAHLSLDLKPVEQGVFDTKPPFPPQSLRILETSIAHPVFLESWVFGADHVCQYVILGDMFALTDVLCDLDAMDDRAVGLHAIYHVRPHLEGLATRFFSSPQCAGALTHLKVMARNNDFDDLDLGMAVNLESLEIHIDLNWGADKFDLYTAWIQRTQQRARTGVIVDLELRVVRGTPEAIRELDGAIDYFVSNGGKGLRYVDVIARGFAHTEAKFLLCEARGRRVANFTFSEE